MFHVAQSVHCKQNVSLANLGIEIKSISNPRDKYFSEILNLTAMSSDQRLILGDCVTDIRESALKTDICE